MKAQYYLTILLFNLVVHASSAQHPLDQLDIKSNIDSKEVAHSIIKLATGIKGIENDSIILDIFSDTSNNLYIAVKDKYGFLLAVEGVGSSGINTKKFLIPCKLFDNDIGSYVVVSWYMGIPHNGPTYHIIWSSHEDVTDYWTWHINSVPLNNPKLEDRNGDGLYEIVEYHQSMNRNGDVFRFDKGSLKPYH